MAFRLIFVFIVFCFQCSTPQLFLSNTKETKVSISKQVRFIQTSQSIQLRNETLQKNFISFSLQKPFLTAQKKETTADYRMASFRFKESLVTNCNEQSIQNIKTSPNRVTITGTVFGDGCSSEYELNLFLTNDKEAQLEIQFADQTLNRAQILYESFPEEKFYGFGEQFSFDQMKGKTPFFFSEEQGVGRGDQPITTGANLIAGAGGNEYTTYAPIPHYISSENRSFFYENAGYAKISLKDPNFVLAEFWDFKEETGIKSKIWLGSSPKELVTTYTKKTGRFPTLPDWAYGTWLGVQGGSDKVNFIVKQAKDVGNPVTALWIQDWCGRRVTGFGDQLKWRWYADETLYPNFREFVSSMNKQNVHVLGYINSFLADTDPKKPGGDDFKNPLLIEAKNKGYLVKNKENKPYLIQTVGFPAYLIDLTNPEAVKWTKDLIKKNLIGMGLSGWMADFGEWLPYDAKLHSGIDAKIYHNRYPVDWARINREAIKEAGKEGKIIFFTRAGFSYANQYSTLFWEGDQMVSWGKNDGLPSSIIGLTSSGISGFALNHSDIGGYTTISNPLFDYHRSKELLLRWAETSAFTTVFRTHEGNKPLKNWQVYNYTNWDGTKSLSDDETVKKFAEIANIHYFLKPYIQNLVNEASNNGLPVVRHSFLVEPNDQTLLSYNYQFFLGDDLLVAPVIHKRDKYKDVYLPKGKWKHVWTNTIYEGGKEIEVAAPIGKPPAFIRMGSKSQFILESAFLSLGKTETP
ncbi:alpha-glucosidase [Leptospira sp. 96542]|nr:alpha-glucosidase [Leptospira sp. 96542]